MVQSDEIRLVTYDVLEEKFETEVPLQMAKTKSQLLGDLFRPVRTGSKVPLSEAIVSYTKDTVTDGFVPAGAQNFYPQGMYDIAEVNWSDQTLTDYGVAKINHSKASTTSTCFDFTTMFEGQYMVVSSIKLPTIAQTLRVWINDVEVKDWYLGTRAGGVLQQDNPFIVTTGDYLAQYLNIAFPKHGIYKVRVAGVIASGGGGLLSCNTEGKFFKPRKQHVFGVIADSLYDTLAGLTSLNAGTELSARMGWLQWNMAVGGAGFVNPGPEGAGNPMQHGSDNVFAALLKAPPLDLLILNGSLNDMPYPEADVIAAMQAFFVRWRTVRPETPIVWQGLAGVAFFENLYTSAAILAREAALAAVALADPSVIGIIRPGLENWITGTGNTTAPNGTGNQDFITGVDEVHFSDFGTLWNGALVSERLASMPTWKAV